MNPEIESLLRDLREVVQGERDCLHESNTEGEEQEVRDPDARAEIARMDTLLARCDAALAEPKKPGIGGSASSNERVVDAPEPNAHHGLTARQLYKAAVASGVLSSNSSYWDSNHPATQKKFIDRVNNISNMLLADDAVPKEPQP